MGDTGSVAPVTADDPATVGHTALKARVTSFDKKESIIKFSQQDWEQREIDEVYAFLRALKQSVTREPVAIRAVPVAQEPV